MQPYILTVWLEDSVQVAYVSHMKFGVSLVFF
jgi:hypothetical protein